MKPPSATVPAAAALPPAAPARPRILYVSSLPAQNTTSGSVLIHRHLQRAASRFEFFHAHDTGVVHEDSHHFRVPPVRWALRLQSTRHHRFFWSLNHGLGSFVSTRALRALCDRVQPDLLLTVGEGFFVGPLRRLRRHRRIPLVTIHHDWSSNWLPAPSWVRRLMDRQLRLLYAASDVNLCVSRALRDEFPAHPDAWILPPIPDDTPVPAASAATPFQVVYAGVFHHLYRDEIEGLTAALLAAGEVSSLRLYGPAPARGGVIDATPGLSAQLYGGLLKGPAFAQALAGAGALLVVSPFGAEWSKIAHFSFPSKIPEYCRFGKPLLVWGPPGSTAVEWGTRTGAALVVSDPAPAAVVAAIRRLRGDAALRNDLAARAAAAAAGEFSSARLQALFEHALSYALDRAPRPSPAEIG